MTLQLNRRLRVLWILLFWLVVGAGAYVLGVLSSTGQLVEENALSASHFNTNPPAPLGLISTPNIAIALVLLGLVALWVHGILRTLVVVFVPAVAIVASQLLKQEVLWRPDLIEFGTDNTFPSGHMTVATALVGAAIFASPRRVRALITVFGAATIGVVAWQLLTYGWHRPSDVLGALALAVAAFAGATMLTPLHPSRGAWLLRTVSIGLAAAGCITAAAALVLTIIAWRTDSSDLMLNAGQVVSIALCMLAGHSLLRLAVLMRSAKE